MSVKNKSHFLLFIIILIINETIFETEFPCKKKVTDYGSVCLCNADYCDKVPSLNSFETSAEYQLYSTSNENLGFTLISGPWIDDENAADIEILVETQIKPINQTILGFGGAFTDSAGYNILTLPEKAQDQLLETYFGIDGIEYTLVRVPMGGSDFSFRHYSYDDNEDPTLSNFALQLEDFDYKIQLIDRVKNIMKNGDDLKLVASAWTAPPWMKTNSAWTSIGFLKREFYQTWADYYVKFFEAYANEGVKFWAVTTQNEPMTGYLPPEKFEGFPSMAWLPVDLNNWIGTNLGPTIRNSPFSDLKILALDDQRYILPILYAFVLKNETTSQYIDGVAVHFYSDSIIPAAFLGFAQAPNKSLFILATEACTGDQSKEGKEEAVELGSWPRAEKYLASIFDDISYGTVGWMDWNIALDVTGGPLMITNRVDAPIIVNATAQEFYKQPMFYALGHFSKFVIPGSTLVNSNVAYVNESINGENSVRVLSFLRPDNKVTVTIWNKEDFDVTIAITDDTIQNARSVFTIAPKSINTFLYSVV